MFAADCAGEPVAAARFDTRLIVGPENARDRLTALLLSARRSIAIIDPKLTDPAMRALLAERRRAGVRVTCHDGDRVGRLKAHGKLLVVDERAAVVGSLSLSAAHLSFRRELALMSTDRAVVGAAARFLNKLPEVVSL
jgi:phosphatidylserine/phosphatidylglycerophosphate/cardiolipin synthase-like enzyme